MLPGRRFVVRTISFPGSILFLAFGAVAIGCNGKSGSTIVQPDAAAGGATASGGAAGSGPVGGSGGTNSGDGVAGGGGSTATGGMIPTGGTVGSGGTSDSAGGTATGGTGANGGRTGNGGTTTISTGGTTATGGTPPTGGTTANGGATGRGGATGSGGATGNGGATSRGGSGTGGSTITGSGGSTSSGGSSGGPIDGGGTSTTTIPGNGCTPPAAYANLFVSLSGHTQAESDAKVAAAWSKLFNPSGSGNIYFNGPGSDESYVKDTYNNDVRTEGMGYGMMTAVQLDHQTEFDRLWTWVKTHMANGTGEISWSCSTSGSKNSSGGAPDGEEYMATALIFAHTRWGDTSGKYNYATEAQWVLDVIRTKYFNSTYHIVKFVSGSGNTDASYILPAFYQVWACFDTANKAFWDSSVTAGRDFFHSAIDGNGVIPDQSSFTGGTVKGATVDWIRCVVNIMMDCNFFNADPWQIDTYATKFGAHEKNVGAGAQGFCDSLLGFGLPASSGKAFVDKLWSAAIPTSYWDGTLYTLALLHVSGTFHLWY
jgi:oligosaccharide reducing-end xylanase